jgi:hypothetical protein
MHADLRTDDRRARRARPAVWRVLGFAVEEGDRVAAGALLTLVATPGLTALVAQRRDSL